MFIHPNINDNTQKEHYQYLKLCIKRKIIKFFNIFIQNKNNI
jgi:hypothetical protein